AGGANLLRQDAAAAAEVHHQAAGGPLPAEAFQQGRGGVARDVAEAGVVDVGQVTAVAVGHAGCLAGAAQGGGTPDWVRAARRRRSTSGGSGGAGGNCRVRRMVIWYVSMNVTQGGHSSRCCRMSRQCSSGSASSRKSISSSTRSRQLIMPAPPRSG